MTAPEVPLALLLALAALSVLAVLAAAHTAHHPKETPMLAVDPDRPTRRDHNTCPHCGATPGGCRGRHWLGGRFCCDTCRGDHDNPGNHGEAR